MVDSDENTVIKKKTKRRFDLLSRPRPTYGDGCNTLPPLTPRGIRMSAIRGRINESYINAIAYPSVRRLLLLKKLCKNQFSETRLRRINNVLQGSNGTCYTKLANLTFDPKQAAENAKKKKKAWKESEWKKHMDLIAPLAQPRKMVEAEEIDRGPKKPLEELIDHMEQLATLPAVKAYRRPSQDLRCKDIAMVSRFALKYVPTDRVKELAKPRPIHQEEK